MNYGTPYTPNYAAPAAAYAQSPYDAEAYAQAQQHAAALEQLQQMYGAQPSYDPYAQQYPMVYTGQAAALPGGAVIAATPPNLTPLQGAWWQQSLYGMPYWSIAAGAAALTGIGLAWKAGVFGGKMGGSGGRSMSRTTVRRSMARDASSPRSGTRSKPSSSSASSSGERDMGGGRARKRTRAGTRRRRASGGARGRRY